MYTDFFHLKSRPFTISPDPRYLYMSDRHQEALAHLLYGLNDGGGFVALTGEVGTGKTTLCYHVLNQLPDNVELALILNPRVSAVELLATLCDELGVDYPKQTTSVKTLVDCLNQHLLAVHASGRKTVVMIDEAQNLSFDVLEQVRLLTNLETCETKLLQMILVGQPELNQMLEKENLRQLLQRITARYHLQALSFDETRHYIEHRLNVSGASSEIFEPGAIKVLYKKSRGIPRLINSICDRAMMGAYGQGLRTVTASIMRQAIRELFPVFKPISVKTSRLRWALGVVALLGMLAGWLAPGWLQLTGENESDVAETAQQRSAIKAETSSVVIIEDDGLVQQPVQGGKVVLDEKNTEMSGQGFHAFLSDSGLSSLEALELLQNVWALQAVKKSCQQLDSAEIGCFEISGSWQTLLAFNRPAVMRFVNEQREIVMLVLESVENDDAPVFLASGGSRKFNLADVLRWWDGTAWLLWRKPGVELPISIASNNEAVGWLRMQMDIYDGVYSNVDNPGVFDADLLGRVKRFQRHHGLTQDGVVGAKTIVHINHLDTALDAPKLIK